MNKQLNWEAASKSITRACFSPSDTLAALDIPTWVRAIKVTGAMQYTAMENASFVADVHSLDNAQVDWLDYDNDLADDAEWERGDHE